MSTSVRYPSRACTFDRPARADIRLFHSDAPPRTADRAGPLPFYRLADAGSGNPIRQLQALQRIRTEMPSNVHMSHELAGRTPRPGRYQPNPPAMMVPDQAHRLGDVAVVADPSGTTAGRSRGSRRQVKTRFVFTS